MAKVPILDPTVLNQDIRRSAPIEFLRATIISFLQGLFAQCAIGYMHWDKDPGLSEILIVSDGAIKSEIIGARPAVIVSRSTMQFLTSGMDDMVSMDMSTGEKQKTVYIPGNVILHAISRNSIEAENLAFFIAEHVWILKDLLMKQGFVDIGQNIVIGELSPAGAIIAGGDAEEWYSVDVSIPFQMLRSARITPLISTIMSSIDNHIISNGALASNSINDILEHKVETLGKLKIQSVVIPKKKLQVLHSGVMTDT